MTGGGGEQTEFINRSLAMTAKEHKMAMAVGSQMSAIKDASQRKTYEIVRKTNPDGVIFANIGSEASPKEAGEAVEMIGADALQVHLNAVQELVMPEGDRDFSQRLDNLSAIVSSSKVPVIVKEVGFGISMETAAELKRIGVHMIDAGGTGGTNFSKIENLRRKHPISDFDSWGITAAAALIESLSAFPGPVFASGGYTSPLHIVKALAAGAVSAGMAGAFLHVLMTEGEKGLMSYAEDLHNRIKVIMTAAGAESIPSLSHVPLVIKGDTFHWLEQRGIETSKFARRKPFSR
jgi:isopentenyl-diphosphate delta-isomerase